MRSTSSLFLKMCSVNPISWHQNILSWLTFLITNSQLNLLKFTHHNRLLLLLFNSSLAGFKRGRVTDQTLIVCYYTKHVLIIWHVLSFTAFCKRIYVAGRRLSSFKLSSSLFGIMPFVNNTSGIICINRIQLSYLRLYISGASQWCCRRGCDWWEMLHA